ncbi:MAG: PQQ-binding-like beta-propeller repeat protein [Bacteroidales bacterium]|nr:PQQ-binding-like beta-propeller repeat protein [Bacteroidales bacterium]
MKHTVRNIAIVSAIFAVAFSVMLITNYFQVSGTDIIRSEALENLKQANEEYGDNPFLQEQIRELDLLARKAYFISINRLRVGVIILAVMVAVLVISLRIYFSKSKEIPDKDIDPVDDWLIKSKARKYVVWTAGFLAAAGIVFAVLTSPYIAPPSPPEGGGVEDLARTDISAHTDLQSVREDSTDYQSELITETNTALQSVQEKTDTLPTPPPSGGLGGAYNGFRGNNALGISSAKSVPTSWDLSSGKNILWKVKTPRKGYNSPVINGNRVFFSGADDDAREIYCYELSSGKELWRLTAKNIPGSPSQMPKTTDDTGLAASTVATNGKQVCAIFATGDVICADMEGKQLWAKNIGVPDNHYGYASSPLVFGNSVIIQYDNRTAPRVMALDLETGNQRWVKERPDKISWSSPIIAIVNNKPQLILMGTPSITSYNPNNGEQYWRVECMTGEVGSSPAAANGVVYGGSEYATLIAINAADGSTLWKNNDLLPEVSSPVAAKDFLFVATSYGVVATFDAQTGDLLKTMELGTEFYSSPVIAEGKIYLSDTDGKMFIFSAKSDFSLINAFETSEKTYATPAFTDGKIVVKTDTWIYCVGVF